MTEQTSEKREWSAHVRDVALWIREAGIGILGYSFALACAVAGWYDSFIGLHGFGMRHMGLSERDAWFVPVTFDGGALALMMIVARASMNGRGAPVWRLGVFALTGLSSWINFSNVADTIGKRIAALLPVVAACVFEGLMDEARKAYEARTGKVRPRLSLLRWFFDFQGTKAILKAYVLGQPLPDGFAEAAVEVAEEKEQQATGKPARRKVPVTAKPATERPVVTAPVESEVTAEGQTPPAADGAELIDLTKGTKKQQAIALWLENPGLSLSQIDRKISGNRTATKAVNEFTKAQGFATPDDFANHARREGFSTPGEFLRAQEAAV